MWNMLPIKILTTGQQPIKSKGLEMKARLNGRRTNRTSFMRVYKLIQLQRERRGV